MQCRSGYEYAFTFKNFYFIVFFSTLLNIVRWYTGDLAVNSAIQTDLPTILCIEWVKIFISSVFYSLPYSFHKISGLISFCWKLLSVTAWSC